MRELDKIDLGDLPLASPKREPAPPPPPLKPVVGSPGILTDKDGRLSTDLPLPAGGLKYKSVPELAGGSCKGCFFDKGVQNGKACHHPTPSLDCFIEHIIYVAVEC